MIFNCLRCILLGIFLMTVESQSAEILGDDTKGDQAIRPGVKRAQEVLMFGNQQNRRPETPAASKVFIPSAEKRTLGTSGLEDVKAALAEGETYSHPKQLTWSHLGESPSPREKNYEYGKIMMNEIDEDLPRVWDLPRHPRYFGLDEERRKRSEKNTASPSNSPTQSTTVSPSATSPSPLSATRNTPRPNIPFAQEKRSLLSYQEPRYKRALVDREDLLALLSLWENQPRGRNWRSYGNDEYENIEEDGNYGGFEDEDTRAGAWLDGPVYTPHHYNFGSDIMASDIGIPRSHPVNSYEKFGNQYASPYENTQYGSAQYGALYPHANYYPQEKRYMVQRKRSQGYDNYAGRNLNDIISFSQLMNSQPQGYSNYPQRMLY